MRYGEGLLDEILRRTDIVQLVGRRVKLARRGRMFWGCCPFHKEKSPSFKVENERRSYKCFGCGVGGNAFQWLMEIEGLTFPEAVERLAGDAGVELPKWSDEDEARERKRKSLYDVVEDACQFFEQQLRGRGGQAARDYVVSRGVDEAAVKQFRLGYAPATNAALIEHLRGKKLPLQDIIAAGLARDAEQNRPARDFFFDRLMFPIADGGGRIVAFGGRALSADAKPKYINTGETQLFSKGRLLYNFASARPAALKTGSFVVAEGYMDVIAMVRAGLEAAVAPLGTALTEDHLALLWRGAPEPVLSFDGDEAGRRAAFRAAALALPLLAPGHSLRFAFLPAGEDPDSLIRTEGPRAMHAAVEKAIPLVEMIWQLESGRIAADTPERKASLIARLNERLGEIRSTDVRRFYLDAFARLATAGLGVRAYAFNDRLQVSATAPRRSGEDRGHPWIRKTVPPAPNSPGLRSPAARKLKETEVLALLLDAPEIIERQHEQLAALPLADRSLDNLRNELLNLAASGFRLETGTLEGHLERAGMGHLVERLKLRRMPRPTGSDLDRKSADGGGGDTGEIEAKWLRAAAQLRDMAESDPERRSALERFISEASEESWRDWHRLHPSRGVMDE
ncbi:MAG TPA: DNA primase [Rhizomicrobium sp.]|jgi:DNA primase|nr:DNA primase [Rhizomicrobium sp.]